MNYRNLTDDEITALKQQGCLSENWTNIYVKDVFTSDNIFNFTKILFETTSAFGTVGLSMGYDGGVTSFAGLFSVASKYLIIITMLFGRVGPLVVLAALPWKRRFANAPPSRDYDDVEKMQIG